MSLKKVPFGDTKAFNVIIEVKAGGRKKYKYDHKFEAMKLLRVLYDHVKYPFNYGCVAQTLADDGDNLDAFVISTHPLARGTVAACRAIGMMEAFTNGKKDHKILAVPLAEHRLEKMQKLGDLPIEDAKKLEKFIMEAVRQWGIDTELKGYGDRESAIKELLRTQVLD